ELGRLPFEALPGEPVIDVTARERVVEPGRLLRVVLSPAREAESIDGHLQVEKADDLASRPPRFVPVGRPLKVQYEGPLAESLGLLLQAPAEPGGFRVAYYPKERAAATGEPTGSDEFFVQQAQQPGTTP